MLGGGGGCWAPVDQLSPTQKGICVICRFSSRSVDIELRSKCAVPLHTAFTCVKTFSFVRYIRTWYFQEVSALYYKQFFILYFAGGECFNIGTFRCAVSKIFSFCFAEGVWIAQPLYVMTRSWAGRPKSMGSIVDRGKKCAWNFRPSLGHP
jgi:hypothetical protein